MSDKTPRVITVPPGTFGLEGIVKKSHTEERDGRTVTVFDEVEVTGVGVNRAMVEKAAQEQDDADPADRLADQLEAMGVGELLRSGQGHIVGYVESYPPDSGVTITTLDVKFTNAPQKLGLVEIDGEPRLVPQNGERLTVPVTAGRHVHNGTDEIKGYDGRHRDLDVTPEELREADDAVRARLETLSPEELARLEDLVRTWGGRRPG